MSVNLCLCHLRSSEYCKNKCTWQVCGLHIFKSVIFILNSMFYIIYYLYYIFHGNSLSRVTSTVILTKRTYIPIIPTYSIFVFIYKICINNIIYYFQVNMFVCVHCYIRRYQLSVKQTIRYIPFP